MERLAESSNPCSQGSPSSEYQHSCVPGTVSMAGVRRWILGTLIRSSSRSAALCAPDDESTHCYPLPSHYHQLKIRHQPLSSRDHPFWSHPQTRPVSCWQASSPCAFFVCPVETFLDEKTARMEPIRMPLPAIFGCPPILAHGPVGVPKRRLGQSTDLASRLQRHGIQGLTR